MTTRVRRALIGAASAAAAARALSAVAPARSYRTNFRGRRVCLVAGPALAASLATSPVAATAAVGAGLVGGYDDVAGDRAKGFRGHLGALARGQLTAGAIKVIGISTSAAAAAGQLRPRAPADVLLGTAVIAGSANLVNLLDLRPGRALKVGLLVAAALDEPGIAGSCAALLPADLAERAMLGDTGANALGAALGVAGLRRLPSRRGRAAAVAGLCALTAASEWVSFSALIDRTPALRWVDRLGRHG